MRNGSLMYRPERQGKQGRVMEDSRVQQSSYGFERAAVH